MPVKCHHFVVIILRSRNNKKRLITSWALALICMDSGSVVMTTSENLELRTANLITARGKN